MCDCFDSSSAEVGYEKKTKKQNYHQESGNFLSFLNVLLDIYFGKWRMEIELWG